MARLGKSTSSRRTISSEPKVQLRQSKESETVISVKCRRNSLGEEEGGGTTGTVVAKTQQSDRSDIIETDNGAIRRNRRHLEPANMLKDEAFASDTFDQDNNMQSVKNLMCANVCGEKLSCTSQNQSATNVVSDKHVRVDQKSSRITRSGRVSKPVQRLDL